MSCSYCRHCLVQKRIPDYHLHVVGSTRYQSDNTVELYTHWYHEQSAASVTVIESLEFGKITSISADFAKS